jgi:hypothetical protein
MAATWKIVACDYTKSLNSKTDVITNVHWEVIDSETVSDKAHNGRSYGAQAIDTSDLSSFTAYASVTEANAIAWAKEGMGSDAVTAAEASVATQIAESKTPTSGVGTPWS